MAQKGSSKSIEEIRAAFLEISTDKGPETESNDLAKKMLENNFKLCMFAELFEQKAEETRNQNQNDPKIEMLKHGKAAVEVLKQYYQKLQEKNSKLREEQNELKMKRQQKRLYDKNKHFYTEYREKIFPMLMQDCDKKEELIDELNENASDNCSEKELKQITRELEKAKKENERLQKTEQDIIEIRRKNEVIEVETCRIQVRNIEMENEIRLFDEYVLENKIVELQEKIKNAKEAKLQRKEDKNNKDEFKNPNDFPTLLDFLDKSKKLKHKKRKLKSPSRHPSKRRKNKTGSYTQHDNNGKLQNNGQPQVKLLSPKSSRPSRSTRSPGSEKVRVMKSYGLQLKTTIDDNSANLSAKPSNEPSNKLQRTFASTNLANTSSNRPVLQRQKPVSPSNNAVETHSKARKKQPKCQKQESPKRYLRYESYETDSEGNLLLQRFPSIQLLPDEAETCEEAPGQISSKIIQKEVPVSKVNNNQPALPNEAVTTVEVPANNTLERLDTELLLEAASVSKQPSVERDLRPRRSLKQKFSPKKAEKHDKKEVNRKKVKSPKKETKKSRGRKKIDKTLENEMIVDNLSLPADNTNDNQIVMDENVTMIHVDNIADKLMAVDENLIVGSSVDYNAGSSNKIPSNLPLITESTGNNVMDVDQNVQVQENDPKMPEITSNAVDEVNMEQENSGNENIEIFDMDMEVIDPNKTGETSIEMSTSFERLFGSSPNTSGNLEMNQSFDFNFDNSREMDGNDNFGSKDDNNDDFFGFNTANNNKDDFFGDGSFKSNEGTADDFF